MEKSFPMVLLEAVVVEKSIISQDRLAYIGDSICKTDISINTVRDSLLVMLEFDRRPRGRTFDFESCCPRLVT